MSEFQYKAGLNHVGSYQISGVPYVTGNLLLPANAAGSASLEVSFPSVTSLITYTNHGAVHARIGFSNNGVKNTNFYLVEPSGSVELKIRTTKLFLVSNSPVATCTSGTIAASLTGITGYDLTTIYSGSNGIG